MSSQDAAIGVLHVIPQLPVGGAEMLVFHMVRGLDRRRFAPAVCVLGELGPTGAEMERAGIEVTALESFRIPGRLVRVVRGLVRLIRARGVQIVHTHLYHGNYYGRLAAFAAGVPVTVASVHNVYDRVKTHRRWTNRVLGRRTDVILAGSETVRQDILRWDGVRADKVRILPYGIDLDPYLAPLDREAARRALDVPLGSAVIGTVSRLEVQKAHDVLLRAFAALRAAGMDAVLILVGDGREKGRLQEMAGALGLQDRVRFLGTRRDLPLLFAAMDVFALPSRWEGTPLALIGAMAASVPVVATPVGGVATVVEDGKTGRLVPVEDVEALAAALAGALRDRATSKALADAGRNHVIETCSVAAMVRGLEAVYLELLGKKVGNAKGKTDN
jgi:glycosyltransferase involved in cell wall biosynthesis